MEDAPLTPWLLDYGYRQGAFPMGEEDGTVLWYRVQRRCLIPIEGIRVSHSLARTLKKGGFEIRFDTAFERVMRLCRRPDDNWINEPIIHAFTAAHEEGWAHCGEVWRDGDLVGGVYGLALGSLFCAESMFHRERDMSKVALKAMVDRCRELGFTAFDAQIWNPHLASLGGYEISSREYASLLRKCLRRSTPWSKSDETRLLS